MINEVCIVKKRILIPIFLTIIFVAAFLLSACGNVEFNINFIVDGEVYVLSA